MAGGLLDLGPFDFGGGLFLLGLGLGLGLGRRWGSSRGHGAKTEGAPLSIRAPSVGIWGGLALPARG
jgi:hypothetical protein